MTTRTKTILTDEHHRQLIEAERQVQQAVEIMDSLEQCGSDCQQLREVASELLNRLASIRKQFLPNARKG